MIGIDNSEEMLGLANQRKSDRVEYRLADIFVDELPRADFINSPFVVNYAKNLGELMLYVKALYKALNSDGKLILVYDLPSGENLKKFGARKLLSENKSRTGKRPS